jgi:uncharacterized BrkB/YihY/UPF0761 family membrane protein
MSAARKKQRRGARLDETGGVPTLVGTENPEDLSHRQLVAVLDERHRQRVREKTLLGLTLLLGIVLPLGTLALVGVAAGWFDRSFALQVLVLTLTPSFTAWLLVVRWAFRRNRRGGA